MEIEKNRYIVQKQKRLELKQRCIEDPDKSQSCIE